MGKVCTCYYWYRTWSIRYALSHVTQGARQRHFVLWFVDDFGFPQVCRPLPLLLLLIVNSP